MHIFIVGAGPAGAMAAYLLSQKHQVTLIEAKPAVVQKVCGEYLCPPGKGLLISLGFKDFIDEHFEPIKGMRIVSQKGTEVICHFPTPHEGLALKRDLLENKLIEMARNQGTKIIFNEAFENCTYEKNEWTIKTRNQTFKADLLVGADGRRSQVSKLLKLHQESTNNRVAIHCFLEKKKNFLRLGEMHLFPDGTYTGLNPIKDGHTNFSLVCNNHKIKEHKNLSNLINHYIQASKILSEEFNLTDHKTHITSVFPVGHETKDIITEHAALIGDAAGFVDPLTGEGIYQGLLSAKILANNIEDLGNYKKIKTQLTDGKRKLNVFFQWSIKQPWFCERIAQHLKRDTRRAEAFVGVIGNIDTPISGLKKILF